MTVTRDVAPDDGRIYVESDIHGKLPNPVRVPDGELSTTVRVTGKGTDDRGEYLELDGTVGTSFDTDAGVTERYTDEVIQYELGASKRALTDLGLSVSNFVAPYCRYGRRARTRSPVLHRATANGYYGGRGRPPRPPRRAQLLRYAPGRARPRRPPNDAGAGHRDKDPAQGALGPRHCDPRSDPDAHARLDTDIHARADRSVEDAVHARDGGAA